MMGRKFEEGDWAEVYSAAKGIPSQGWSNLNIDIMHNGLGVEHKMLCYRSNVDLADAFGRTLMHPAATRSIRIPEGIEDPDKAMGMIFRQYADLIRQRTEKVRETAPRGKRPDMRTGWLLWQESLRQFLYFEVRMEAPRPEDHYAQWRETHGGARKGSRNLWVFEKATGRKRYSITTAAGAKIQPYFDVPPPNDRHVYLFTVIGEVVGTDRVRLWVADATYRELTRLLGQPETERLSEFILRKLPEGTVSVARLKMHEQPVKCLALSLQAYSRLKAAFPGKSDDHSLQLFLAFVSSEHQGGSKPPV